MTTMMMLDLETGGAEPCGAAVFTIGAVVFTNDGIVDEAYYKIDPRWATGRRDADTYEWWHTKVAGAELAEALSGLTLPWDAAEALSEFCGLNDVKLGWAYPARFDYGHLREMYHAVGHKFPLEFWRELDMTTLLKTFEALRPELYPRLWEMKKANASAHNALADARNQAERVIFMCRELGINYLAGSRL